MQADQTRLRTDVDRLSDTVSSVRAMETTLKAVADGLAATQATHDRLANSVSALTVSVTALQQDFKEVRGDQRDLVKAKTELTRRIAEVEIAQASALSRALPMVFGALGTAAAIVAAMAGWIASAP